MIDLGFRFVTMLTDGRLMAMKAAEVIGEMRDTEPDRGSGSQTY